MELSSLYFIVKQRFVDSVHVLVMLLVYGIRGMRDLIESPHTECQDLKPLRNSMQTFPVRQQNVGGLLVL